MIDEGEHTSVIPVIAGGAAVTVIFAEPEMFVNPATVDVAVQLPVPAPDGVKTPLELMVPPVADQLTAELNNPVPETVAAHVVVCDVVMDDGTAATRTAVIVKGAEVTVIFAEPVTFV